MVSAIVDLVVVTLSALSRFLVVDKLLILTQESLFELVIALRITLLEL